MKSFRARTELLLSKYEDIDEVSHDEFQISTDDDDGDDDDKVSAAQGRIQKRLVI